MALNGEEVIASAYRRMGTKSSDPEYPAAQMLIYLNVALGELHDDCARLAGGDVLLTTVELTPTADRTYALAEQQPPITSVTQIRRVRLASDGRTRLAPVAAESLEAAGEYAYAASGPDSAIILRTSDAVGTRAVLDMDFTPGPPTLANAAEVLPAWLPDQYRDVVELLIVDAAMPQGGESKIAARQLEKLDERRAQLWTHWSSRNPGNAKRRDY